MSPTGSLRLLPLLTSDTVHPSCGIRIRKERSGRWSTRAAACRWFVGGLGRLLVEARALAPTTGGERSVDRRSDPSVPATPRDAAAAPPQSGVLVPNWAMCASMKLPVQLVAGVRAPAMTMSVTGAKVTVVYSTGMPKMCAKTMARLVDEAV